MSKSKRHHTGPTPPKAPPGMPPGLGSLFALGATASAIDAAAHEGEASGPDTRAGILAGVLHAPCCRPFPSTHKATASWHEREARELLDRLDAAPDAPVPATRDVVDPRRVAAARLEDAESVVRGGDLAALAVELREQDTARTRAIAAAILGT